jgi:U3 small nucleolar RNA-associated protein 11
MSLRNAVKRKTHKERAQPKGRKKLGLLEKHKDYKLRANDFQRKRKAIEILQRKAELRNTDEFYFGMHNERTERGVHKVVRDNVKNQEPLSLEMSRRLDKDYLNMTLAHESNKLKKLESNLHFIGLNPSELSLPRTKIEFITSSDEENEDNDETFNNSIDSSVLSNDKAYNELLRRKQRVDALSNAIKHVELKHNLTKSGKRQEIKPSEGNKPAQYKWRRERLR